VVRPASIRTVHAFNRDFRQSHIRYQRIGDEELYAQELFEIEELTGYLKNMLNSTGSEHCSCAWSLKRASPPHSEAKFHTG
jgi:hypothetical protein